MKKNIDFVVTFLALISASQFSILMPKTIAQTSGTAINNFMMRQKMKIDSQFRYSEIKVTQRQKEEWSNSLFDEGRSLTMRLENIKAIRLSEDELQNNDFDNGIEFIRF